MTSVEKSGSEGHPPFFIRTAGGGIYRSRSVIVSSGAQDILPKIENLHKYFAWNFLPAWTVTDTGQDAERRPYWEMKYETNRHFESSVPGLYIVGPLAGNDQAIIAADEGAMAAIDLNKRLIEMYSGE